MINKIYTFLKANRRFNKAFQNTYWRHVLSPYSSRKDRAYALLHNVILTQSKPKLDKVKNYLEQIYRDKNALKSFKNFCKYHGLAKDTSYKALFKCMKSKPGVGPKTSALFIKNIILLHRDTKSSDLRFWKDVPTISKDDQIYLPVDAVIKDIFPHIKKGLNTFSNINRFIHANNKWKNNLIWDDLWFWGFITQKGSDSPRTLMFNEAKYWIQPYSKKDKATILQVKKRSLEFIRILKTKS